MPEFIIDPGSPEAARTFNDLDEFTQGYVEAMFFTIDEDEADATFAELAPATLSEIIAECKEFQESFAADLAEAVGVKGYGMRSAGVDFWLTRNHHGAGFWDRGLGDVGKKLTDMSHPYGETDLCRGDDGLLHLV